MTDDELIDKLKNMTREVRDLKTAHERGLGTTRFYKYELEIMANAGEEYIFVARVADDEPQTPVMVPMLRVEPPTRQPLCQFTSIGNGTYTISAMGWQSDYMTVAVISSSKLKEFRQA